MGLSLLVLQSICAVTAVPPVGAPLHLPTVDLHDHATAARDVREACERYGAFRVRGHALAPARVAAAREAADAFFGEAEDVKKRKTARTSVNSR